jgi:hypothetical protein
MLPLAAGPLLAIVIAAPAGPEDSCPSARQVTEALQAHVSGALIGPDRGSGGPLRTDALRSVLEVPADGTVVRFSLVDARGDVQLRRTLQAPGRGRPAADCLALAETIATIVERYLSSVPYQAKETEPPPPPALPPPPPPPSSPGTRPPPETIGDHGSTPPSDPGPRAFRPYAGGGWRAALNRGRWLYELGLGSELDLTRGPSRLAALLHLTWGQPQHVDFKRDGVLTATASLWRMSAQAGLAWGRPTGAGVIEIALRLGADFLYATTSSLSTPGKTASPTTSSWKIAPTAEVRVGYRVALLPWLFLRPQLGLGSAIVGYDIRRDAADGDAAIRTPTWFSTLALDAGFVFR